MSAADSGSPFRSRGFIGAAIIVGVIVVAAVVVLATNLFRGNSDGQPSPSPSTSATSSAGDAEPSACGLDGYEDTSSLTSAPDNEWELVGTMAAPSDPSIGPGTIDDTGFRTCFVHTAEGALFAAVNFVATGTDATLGPRLIELVAPGPGRDALENASSGGSASGLRAQVAGYKISSYQADAATIDLALNYSTGQLVSVPLKMAWAEGDWRVEMTASGELPLSPAQLQNLGGYTPWSGA